MAALFLVIGGFVSYILLVLLSGIVLVDLWGWFVVPVFHLAQLNIPQALGFSLLVGYLTKSINTKQDENSIFYKFGLGFFWSLTMWGLGWIISRFI